MSWSFGFEGTPEEAIEKVNGTGSGQKYAPAAIKKFIADCLAEFPGAGRVTGSTSGHHDGKHVSLNVSLSTSAVAAGETARTVGELKKEAGG